MPKSFSFPIVFHLLRREWYLRRSSLGSAALALGLVLLLVFLLAYWQQLFLSAATVQNTYGLALVVLGALFVLGLFKEAHQARSAPLYLALPASSLERMLAAWLLGSLALPAALLLLVWLAGQAAVLLGAALLSAQAHTVWIGAEGLWAIWGPYLWFQPVLLFGAVAFARNRLAKTLLYSLLIMAALGLFNVALFFGLNGHYLWAHFSLMEGNQLMMDGSPYQWLKWILLTVWWLALLLAAYFKLTEKEG